MAFLLTRRRKFRPSPYEVLVACLSLCLVTGTLGSTRFVHETGEEKSSSYSRSEDSGKESHITYTRVSDGGGEVPQVPSGHGAASVSGDTTADLAASRAVTGSGYTESGFSNVHAAISHRYEAGSSSGHGSYSASSSSSSSISSSSSNSSYSSGSHQQQAESGTRASSSHSSQQRSEQSADTASKDQATLSSSRSSDRTSASSARTSDRKETQSDERASSSRRMSELDRVSAMSANTEQRDYFMELFSRRCTDCVVNGETYRGHSRFEYDEGCSRYRCICSCDGSHNCPAQYTINICQDGKVQDPSSTESRHSYVQRRRCQRCQAYGQEFEGNAYFDVQDGCMKYRGCICYCNGTWTCPGEREVNTCEEPTTPAPAPCRSCNARGKVVQGNTYFELEELCKKYNYCRCRCDGSWECPDEYVEDTCKTQTTTAPPQDSSCRRCNANGKEVQGNTYFELTEGCIEYRYCVCRCNGSWTCPPQYARDICQGQGGTGTAGRNRTSVMNTAECQSCRVYGKYFRGNTYFNIRDGCTRYSNCVCRCDGSWDCPARYSTNVCTDGDGGDVREDYMDDPCSFCDAHGKIIPSNSIFDFTEGCVQYNQCLCHCDGKWTCPEHYARNVCELPAGGLVSAERDCSTCVVDSRVVRGNTRFNRVSDCYRYRDCLCKCDGTYECPPERAENICQFDTTLFSSTSASTPSPSTACRRCFAYGLFQAPGARFTHEEGCVENECYCHCNGTYTCPPERARDICQAGCSQCELDGQVIEGNTYFKRRGGCVEYTCTCFCNGSWDCPADRADRTGCTSTTVSRDSGSTATNVSRTGCSQCIAKDGQTHQPDSDFVLSDGCIHYRCRCNCDGSWECPGETARNVCRGEVLGGCRSCVISETQIYRGDEDFVMRDSCINYNCHCNCDGSWECPGEEARDICLGEVPGGCRVCRVSENETFRGDSDFQLRQGCIHYQCKCHCNGSWECPGEDARDVCTGEVPGGCRVCKLESGEIYRGESDFQLAQNCILYNCRCNCDGSWNCPGENARRICNADGSPLIQPALPQPQGQVNCGTCVVSDTEQFQGGQPFTLRRGCNEYQCQCECDSSWNCPANRTRNVCGTKPDPSLQAETCRVCRVSGYIYPGSSSFLLTRGCKQYACRCDCNGRWSCDHTVARDICQDQATLQTDNRQGAVASSSGRTSSSSFSSVSSSAISQRQSQTIASTTRQAPVSTARGRSVAETRLDSTQAVVQTGVACRPCVVDGVERAPDGEFVIDKPCKRFNCFCACNGRWRCPREKTVDLCPQGQEGAGTDSSSSSSSATSSSSGARQLAVGYLRRLEADRRRYSTDYRRHSPTDGRSRGTATTVYTQPGGQRYGTTSIRVVGADTASSSSSSSSSSSYSASSQHAGQDAQDYGRFNVRGYYVDGTRAQYGQTAYDQGYEQGQDGYDQGPYSRGTDDHGQVTSSQDTYNTQDGDQAGRSDYQFNVRSQYSQGQVYGSGTDSAADSMDTDDVGASAGSTCQPCQVDDKIYQTGAKFDWRRGCVVYKCTCLCSGSYRCRLSIDPECDPSQASSGPGGLPGLPSGPTANEPGGACGNCYVQGYVFPGNMSFTLRQGCEELSCKCGCDGAHECLNRTPIPGCTAMSTPLAGALYPYGSAAAVYPIGGGGYAVRPAMPGRVYNTFQQSYFTAGGGGPGRGVLVPVLIPGQMPDQRQVVQDQQQQQVPVSHSTSTNEMIVPMRQVPVLDAAREASMEDKNCASCFANGRSYRGSFEYTKDCYHVTCYCDCKGKLRCSVQPAMSPACPPQYGPVSGQCRSCVVQGNEYPPSVQFALRVGCYGYDCTCGCDGLWMCQTQMPTNYCVQPASPPAGMGDNSMAPDYGRTAQLVDRTYSRTAELTDRTYSRSAELTDDTGTSCTDCEVRGTTYPSRSKFFLRDGCLQHTCDCECDGSWICPRSTVVDICQEGQSEEKQQIQVQQEMEQQKEQKMRQKHEDETMSQKERALAEVAAFQARLAAKQDSKCRRCVIDDKTYLTNADFQYRQGCYQYTCTCYCNGTFQCPLTNIRNLCAEGDFSSNGCRECHVANKSFPGGAPFTYHDGCWEFNCQCGCNGQAECPPEQSRDLCKAGASPDQSQGDEGSQGRCKPCMVDGQVMRARSTFSLRRGCTEFLCECACNGSWSCPQDRSFNYCDEANIGAGNDLTAAPKKGCTVGRKTYFTRLFAYYDGCVQYMCICYDSGAWRCPPGKERRVC